MHPNTVDTLVIRSGWSAPWPQVGMFHSTGQPVQAWTGGGWSASYMTWVLPKPSLMFGPTPGWSGGGGSTFSLAGQLRGSSQLLRLWTSSPESVVQLTPSAPATAQPGGADGALGPAHAGDLAPG